MNCKTIDKKLIFYLDGDLSASEMQLVSEHIATCPDCSAKLDFIKDSLQIIDIEKEAETKPFMYTRIQGRMQPVVRKTATWALASLAFASVLVIGLLIGTMVGEMTLPRHQVAALSGYEVSDYFNDEQMESSAYRLLNE